MLHVTASVDLFLRQNFIPNQIRKFSLSEKIKIQAEKSSQQQSLLPKQNHLITESALFNNNSNWISVNRIKSKQAFQRRSRILVIYPYSLSNNLLREVLLKMGVKFALTNEIRKANLIIGLKKHLQQNFKLLTLAKQKDIPIYTLNQISLYQISKLIQFLCS